MWGAERSVLTVLVNNTYTKETHIWENKFSHFNFKARNFSKKLNQY